MSEQLQLLPELAAELPVLPAFELPPGLFAELPIPPVFGLLPELFVRLPVPPAFGLLPELPVPPVFEFLILPVPAQLFWLRHLQR